MRGGYFQTGIPHGIVPRVDDDSGPCAKIQRLGPLVNVGEIDW